MYKVRLKGFRYIYRRADESGEQKHERVDTYNDFSVPDLRALELFVSNMACYSTDTLELEIYKEEDE